MFYHVINKSIAGYQIFTRDKDFTYFISGMDFYKYFPQPYSFSFFTKQTDQWKKSNIQVSSGAMQIIAYCIMPTHFHLITDVTEESTISKFTNLLLNSYSKYFNLSNNRKGPLWQNRSKRILITSEEQLSHLTRYIHINPVRSNLVEKPENWQYSSYTDYITNKNSSFNGFLRQMDFTPESYKQFVNDYLNEKPDI